MSLNEEDLKKIGDLQMDKLIQFWDEVLEKKIFTKDEAMELKSDLKKDNQDTRDYIDKRIREYSGETVGRDKTIVLKADTTADRLGERNVFPPETVTEIKSISPFPLAPAVEQL